MTVYSKLRSVFDTHPSDFQEMTLGLLAQDQFDLAHYPLDLLSLKYGIFHTCQFILQCIILEPSSPVIIAFAKGNFSPLNSYFIHLHKLIDAYQPKSYSKSDNVQMQGAIRSIFVEQYACQEATGFSFHNNEILLGRNAALGDPDAMEWYETSVLKPDNHEIWFHTAVGAYESEKSKWDFSSPDKGIAHLKKVLFRLAASPQISEQSEYFIDYFNVILNEFLYPIKNGKISFKEVQDCFDMVLSLYNDFDVTNSYKKHFQESVERYRLPHDNVSWIQDRIKFLELQSAQSMNLLNKAFEYALELARVNKKEGEEKVLKLVTEIFESSGVTAG